MNPVSRFFRPEHQLTPPGAVGTPVTNVVVEELPKTSTGKIRKNVVRRQHADHYQTRR